MDAGNAAVAGGGGGEKELPPGDVFSFQDGRDIGGADRVGGLAVDQDAFLQERDELGNADPLCEADDLGIKRADPGGVDDGGLPALEDFANLLGCLLVLNGAGDAGGHDFALEGPVVEILEIAAEDA